MLIKKKKKYIYIKNNVLPHLKVSSLGGYFYQAYSCIIIFILDNTLIVPLRYRLCK